MSSVDRLPMLSWLTQRPDRGWLREHGFAVLPFDDLRKRFVEPARGTGARRNTLDSPAQPLLDRFAGHQRVAVLEVRLETVQDLSDLYGYALEPAWRAGCRLIVQADRFLEDLDVTGFVDHAAGYAWTLERARWLAAATTKATQPLPSYGQPVPSRALDSEQLTAVAAHDGVVQVIAPAGSGKTTVLVQRVRELLRRGVPADRILCMTFNAAAAADLRERLDEAGVTGVEARTFHSVGRRILEKEGRLQGQTREPTLPQWRRLCAQASDETGEWIDPADVRQKISDIKLGLLLTATEFAARATDDPQDQAAAWIYEAYEAEQRKAGQHDFDDQILLAVRAMRDEPGLRDRWQRLFDCVLVDEYQDIEPAQELLVRMLAAPQDSLFCVGDEDQVLYGWRRASAQRMVELDQVYPGLKRVALATNYRCPAAVVQCSRALIAHNTLRFPKRIEPGPRNSTDAAAVSLHRFEPGEAAGWTARALVSRRRGEVVVLARTSRLLGQVALACVKTGVLIAAPRRVFEATGARAVIEAHLRLAVQPEQATAEDVASVMRAPARGLRSGAGDSVASRLRNGAVWQAAVVGMGTDEGRIQRAAAEFDHLRTITDAPAFVRTLRTSAGLDEHFEGVEATFGATERVEIEELADAEREAKGMTVAQYASWTAQRRSGLRALRDDEQGVELLTVHGAKGREWPIVIVFGFDEGQLPHKKALDPEQGEGIEAERRVAYVALTRAKERLHVLATKGIESQFVREAGLLGGGSPTERRPREMPLGRATTSYVHRVGARHAVGTSADHNDGLLMAAFAIAEHLVTAEKGEAPTRCRAFLLHIPEIDPIAVDELLTSAGVGADEFVRRLPEDARVRLADELRRRAQ